MSAILRQALSTKVTTTFFCKFPTVINIAYFQGGQLRALINVNKNLIQKKNAFSSQIPPVTALSEEEQSIKDLAAKVSREKILPLVSKMDEESKMDPSIIKAMFDNGVSLCF